MQLGVVMKTGISIFIIINLLFGCRSQLTDPVTRDQGGETTPGEGGDGQGSGGPVGLPAVQPNIELLNLLGGEAIQGGSSQGYPIRFKTESEVGVSANRIEFSRDEGRTWELAQSATGQSGAIFPSIDEELTTFNWAVPSEINCDGTSPTLDGTNYRIRITSRSRPYEPTVIVGSAANFTVDSCAPSLSQNTLTPNLAGNRAGFIGINLSRIEDIWQLGTVSAICIKTESTPPVLDDVCWNPITGVANPVLVENFSLQYFWGFTPISNLALFFWTKDSAGNISQNTEIEGKDYLESYSRECTGAACEPVSISSHPIVTRHDVDLVNVQKSFGIPAADQYWLDQQSFVITSKGKLFYLKQGEGLYVKDVAQDSVMLRVPEFCGMEKDGPMTNYTNEDPAVFTGAIFCNPTRLALDAQENIWVFDGYYIRKIFVNENPMRLETIIGGLAATDGTITKGTLTTSVLADPRELLIDQDILTNSNMQYFGTFEVLPNGWVVFNDQDPFKPATGSSAYQLRIYKPERTTDKIQTLSFQGTGVLGNANQNLDTLNIIAPALIHYNGFLKNIERFTLRLCDLGGGSTCTLHTATFNEFGQAVASDQQFPWINTTGMTRLFQVNQGVYLGVSSFEGKIYQYQSALSGWVPIAGAGARRNGVGCADGTGALSCSLNLIDIAMGPSNTLFLIDQDRIRFIEKLTSEIRTWVTPDVLGPPPPGP